jgi:hypothetical protein
MSVLIRDNRVITPSLRDASPTIGPISQMTISGSASRFTESIDVGTFNEAIAFMQIISQSGTTPTLDIDVQYSPDGKNFGDSGDSFTQMTTTLGVFFKKLSTNFGKYIRFRIKLAGTNPSYVVTMGLAVKG